MMSTNNILSPANGRPIIVPSQDIVLGLYYLSLVKDGEPGEGKVFTDLNEIDQALDAGVVTLHSKVRVSTRAFALIIPATPFDCAPIQRERHHRAHRRRPT